MAEKTKRDIESIVQRAVEDAISFVEADIAPDRIKAQRYFDGEVNIGAEEGRSSVVATKVRDTIRAIKPSLMRVFLSSEHPVEYIPSSHQEVTMADMATKFASTKFEEVGGYTVLSDAFHDALLKKNGVVKAYWDISTKSEIYTFNNINDMEFSAIVNDDDVTVLEHTKTQEAEIDEMGMEVMPAVHDLKISRKVEYGNIAIESVPPEEFFVNREAKNLEDAYIVAHRTEMRVSDLVAMGFDFDEVKDLSSLDPSNTSTEEETVRQGYSTFGDDEDIGDEAMRLVAITEAYMRMDIDGTGTAQMHKFILGGASYKLLDYELWGSLPFAVFEVDPEPHTFYGRSVADLIMNDQDAATAMLRGLLDNIALVNNPALDVVESMVNMDDVLNNEIGAIRRVKQAGAITVNQVPFIAGTTLPALQYYDDAIQVKTGVTRASMGLDPDALQNTTATAAQLTAQQGAAQIEVMARNLAEGGMKQLFRLILELFAENSSEEQMMRLSGDDYQPVDPRSWNTGMNVSVNVGLGTGREEQKAAALQQTLQTQMQIWSAYGQTNGLVSMTQIRNTLADILALGGIRNAERYYNPMNAQIEQQLIAQVQQTQQNKQVDQQAQAFIQAEQIKAQAKLQADNMKLQAQMQIKAQEQQSKAQKDLAELQMKYNELQQSDDLQRDKLDQELIIKAAELLGKYGVQVDTDQVQQLEAMPRQ